MDIKSLIEKNSEELKLFIESGKKIKICGWIKNIRKQPNIIFISINDGSHTNNIQCIIDINDNKQIFNQLEDLTIGASLELKGILRYPPETSKEVFEFNIHEIDFIGPINDKGGYLLSSKSRPKREVLRNYQHIRPKTNMFSAIFKIRSNLMFAIHEYFNKNQYYHVDPNIITTSDCEGAGEVFRITTIDPSNPPYKTENDKKIIDWSKDFFKKEAYLTVSSQLQLEAIASGLGKCYTTNPSFRAEKSNTSRHLASFTHIEYELSFCDLNDLLDVSEEFIKYSISYILKHNYKELEFIDKFVTKDVIKRLNNYVDNPFIRLTYNDAIDILSKAFNKNKLKIPKEELPVWGDDLGSVCEKYLAEKHFGCPIMVYNYPKKLKSFYMKTDPNNPDIVQSMDMLVPYIGELIGSSVREDDEKILLQNMVDKNINRKPLEWYVDLRHNGTWKHAGGGLGFERLVGMVLMDNQNFNIRDCMAFPVAYQECNY